MVRKPGCRSSSGMVHVPVEIRRQLQDGSWSTLIAFDSAKGVLDPSYQLRLRTRSGRDLSRNSANQREALTTKYPVATGFSG